MTIKQIKDMLNTKDTNESKLGLQAPYSTTDAKGRPATGGEEIAEIFRRNNEIIEAEFEEVVRPSDIVNFASKDTIQEINPYLVQNIELYKPNTLIDTAIDLSKVVASFYLIIKNDFRKKNKTARRIKIRAISYNKDTGVVSLSFDVENVDGVFERSPILTSTTNVIDYESDWGIINMELNISKFSNIYEANTPATFEQGGINPNLVETSVLIYEQMLEASANARNIGELRNDLNLLWREETLTLSNHYINEYGQILKSSPSWESSDPIAVTPDGHIQYFGNTNLGDVQVSSLFGYDKKGNPQKVLLPKGDYSKGIIVAIPNNVYYVRGCSLTASKMRLLQFGTTPNVGNFINKFIRWVGMSIWWYNGEELAGTNEIAIGYQDLIKDQFLFIGDTNTKYCYSGNSLGALTLNDASCIMNHSSTWEGTNGDIWTLDSITNDFKRNIPIGSISDYNNDTGVLTYYGALRKFKNKVQELSGFDAIVICSNALKRNNSGYTSTSANEQGHTLLDYEIAIMTIAAENKWYFVDQYRMSGITDNSLSITTIDGLHLNNFGYTLAVIPWINAFKAIYDRGK